MQALFAHLMLRRGAQILEVNTQGHPDVRARIGDSEYLVQVKTSIHSSAATLFEMTDQDLKGIEPAGTRRGFLAFLDSAQPVSWIIVPFDRAQLLLGRPVPVATLRADSSENLSLEYTQEFFDVLEKVGDRLHRLTYPILRARALDARPI